MLLLIVVLDFLQAEFKKLRNVKELSLVKSVSEIETTTTHDDHRNEEKLEKQVQAWRNNPSWTDQPPKVQVEIMIAKTYLKTQKLVEMFLTMKNHFAGENTKWFVLPFERRV